MARITLRLPQLTSCILALAVGCASDSGPIADQPFSNATGDGSDDRQSATDPGDATSGDGLGDGSDGSGASDGADGAYYDDEAESALPDPDVPPEEPENVVANPFVDASKDPFSTFAADVDTASYDNFRQSVRDYDQLPDPAAVRVEDFVNYFEYAYPAPAEDAEHPFAISLAAAAHPMGRSTTLLRVGIQAKGVPAEKPPLNLVYLVDVSGSMSGEKIERVKLVLAETLDALSPTDKVSIVTYAGDTRVRLEPTPVSQRGAIEAQIESLDTGGGTNGGAGLELAYEQAQAGFVQGGINHVVLCTDGDFNLGIVGNDAIVELVRSKRESGVTLTALGVGYGDLNDDMMERVSNAGNGMYSVITDDDDAVKYAHERIFSTMFHVAKDMKIQVEFNPTHVHAYRLLGYENRAIADDDFRDDAVDAGEVGAGHRVTALYEVVLADEPLALPEGAPALDDGETSDAPREIGENELVRVKIRSKLPGANDADPATEVAQALAPDAVGTDVDDDFAWAAAMASFAEILRESPFATPGELAAISDILEAQKTRDAERAEMAALFTKARALLEP